MGFSFGGIGGAIGAAVGLPFVGSTALAGASSALDYISAQKQNEAADNQARAAMDFSASQVSQQEDFQRTMSNTAHQREVKDLVAAGINPLLSANSGASTPSGGAATGVAAPVVPELSQIASGAKDMISTIAQWNQSSAAAAASRASAVDSMASAKQKGVNTDAATAKMPAAQLEGKVSDFFNRMIDRLGAFSAKSQSQDWTPEWIGDGGSDYVSDRDSRVNLQYAPGR